MLLKKLNFLDIFFRKLESFMKNNVNNCIINQRPNVPWKIPGFRTIQLNDKEKETKQNFVA